MLAWFVRRSRLFAAVVYAAAAAKRKHADRIESVERGWRARYAKDHDMHMEMMRRYVKLKYDTIDHGLYTIQVCLDGSMLMAMSQPYGQAEPGFLEYVSKDVAYHVERELAQLNSASLGAAFHAAHREREREDAQRRLHKHRMGRGMFDG